MNLATFTVLLDSCVLYPASIRDLAVELAAAELFRAKWSDDIHNEWITSLLSDRPDLKREQLLRTRDKVNQAVRDCLVDGYRALIDGPRRPDPNDRHVLAAAMVAHASLIVTFNLRDFPQECLDPFHIESQHPDDFFAYQLDLEPRLFCNAVRDIVARLKKPAISIDDHVRK